MSDVINNTKFVLPSEIPIERLIQQKIIFKRRRGQVSYDRDGVPEIKSYEYSLDSTLENLYLLSHKFVPDVNSAQKPIQDFRKRNYIRALVSHWKELNLDNFTQYSDRAKSIRESYTSQGYFAEHFELKTENRLIVGMGYKGSLEVGITLHPLFGFPYIPGTAVKGLARAWAEIWNKAPKDDIWTVFGSDDKNEKQQQKDNKVGEVIFLDAMPTEFPTLEADIMTPHFGEYYGSDNGSVVPGDWLTPNPTFFLTVGKDVPFGFTLLSRNQSALNKASKWLQEGLKDLGIGGKTSSGYGFF